MIAAILVLLAMAVDSTNSSPISQIDRTDLPKRVKRIASGRNLYSNKYFSTEYLVEIRHNFECIVEHDAHQDLLKDCNGKHVCSATLIHPQYVISAAHCLMYTEIRVFDQPQPESFWDRIFESWDDSARAIRAVFILTKPKHTVNSDWSLLAGGTNFDTMTQIRHAFNIFPHQNWPKARAIAGSSDNLAHDILLIQACEPFDIDRNVKPVVLDDKSKLEEHYERIVKMGLVCLYTEMRGKDEEDYDVYSRIPRKRPYTNWTQYKWSPSSCYSACSYERSTDTEHACKLCGSPFGPADGDILIGDSGSPVLCDGKVVAVVNYSGPWFPVWNRTFTASYALHCARNMITENRLAYYSKQNPNRYHPPRKYRKLRRIAEIHQY